MQGEKRPTMFDGCQDHEGENRADDAGECDG